MNETLARRIVWIAQATISFGLLLFVRYQNGFEDMVVLAFVYIFAELAVIGFTLKHKK